VPAAELPHLERTVGTGKSLAQKRLEALRRKHFTRPNIDRIVHAMVFEIDAPRA
jgi:hypothetical protein